MKVFALAPKEDWIVDRFVKEWNQDNASISVIDPRQADVIWLMADWCWHQLPMELLTKKPVLTTIHHIVPDKFQAPQAYEFQARDEITTAYHVPNNYTRDFISRLTSKPIHVIPYWANQSIWCLTFESKESLRAKHEIPSDAFVIGSFQRDTEGASIASGRFVPKLEKGPDLLADYVQKVHEAGRRPHVVLAGWRRQYLISRLTEGGIPYTYIELPDQPVLNELYQTLDVYPITARYEGGPQSLIECGLLGIPVVSRPVGMASSVLPETAIADDVALAQPAVPNVMNLMLPRGYKPYIELLTTLVR